MKAIFKKMTAMASVAALSLSGAAAGLPAFINATPAAAAAAVADGNDDWLHAEGSRLYDKNGNEVWLTGANWFGFNCTECSPHYLWSGDIDDLVKSIADHGVNVLRLPVSTELLYNWMIGNPDPIKSINPNNNPSYPFNVDLIKDNGEVVNSQELFDVLLAKCKKYGVKCFIDIHSPESNNSGHNYGIWYGKSFEGRDGKTVEVTTKVWIDTLAWCADYYKNDDTLIGFDLKNEPHSKYGGAPVDAIWDDSDAPNNWKKAAQDCADAILAKNKNALILIEGVEGFEGHGAWWGGNLRGVRKYPVLPKSGTSQIVYSPHDYGPVVSAQPWFEKDFTEQTLLDDYWYDTWAYLVEEDMYPLLVGEWGGTLGVNPKNEQWLGLIRDYMIKHHVNHTFWCLNDDSGDTGGLWKDISFGTTTDASGKIVGKTTINWDKTKYEEYYYPAIWKTQTSKKFIGLDHKVALGANGISLGDFYANYASTEGSNIDGGKKANGQGNPDPDPVVENPTVSYQAGDGCVKLTWTKVADAQKYGVVGYVGGQWKMLSQTSASSTSTVVSNLTAGTDYKVAVVAMLDGQWNMDTSKAITVRCNAVSANKYPTVKASVQGGQFKVTWTAADKATGYAVAVYYNGKWKQLKATDSKTFSYISPANGKTPKGTYKVAVAAKVNGKWDTANIMNRAVTVTIK